MPSLHPFGIQVCFLGLICLAGCKSVDVTDNPAMRGGYARGMELVSLQKMAIAESGYLIANQNVIRGIESGVGNRNGDFQGMLDGGTTMRITRVIFDSRPEIGDSIHPMAEITHGVWRGKEVDLYLVSKDVGQINTRRGICVILTNDTNLFKRAESKSR
jgi:hypothetical protein